MLRGNRLAEIAVFCAALASGAVRAQTATPSPPAADASQADPQEIERRAAEARLKTTLFGAEEPKARSRACFTRVYDAAHLKAHPYQHVVEIRISAHYDPVERKLADSDAPRAKWGYAIHSRLRDGRIKTFKDEGSCSFFAPGTRLFNDNVSYSLLCNPACDSGDLFVIDPDGKSAKLRQKDDLVHPEFTEPGAPEKLAAKADDSVFRLYRAKDSLCEFDKP
jgi:hypothetical protein